MNYNNFIKSELKSRADEERRKTSQYFFKTGKGEYGEGDVFLGVTVPDSRKIAKKYSGISLRELIGVLHSKIHEERFVALLILINKFEKGSDREKEEAVKFYLDNLKWINNWDLVDVSAYKILGSYLFDKDKDVLYNLVVSENLWERRIAIISTLHFIKNNSFTDTFQISEILLEDDHDLIHKAVGWMLREVGNKSLQTEVKFLNKYYKKMPRTMLRYAVEKFPEDLRLKYLKGEV
ncbi:MAG: DNA alkylation repair protein [Patescibacteria group bacterium]|nr:DNA alkylation repair protein [Patescibacteria group bacterium]